MKKFTKEDLKSGMVVEYKNGKRRLVINNKILGKEGFNHLDFYTEELKNVNERAEHDIKKVYVSRASFIDDIFRDEYLKLIWEREEVQFMTATQMVAKLEELTGKRVEIEPSREEMYGALALYCYNTACSKCVLSSDCFRAYTTTEELKPPYEKLMEEKNDRENVSASLISSE